MLSRIFNWSLYGAIPAVSVVASIGLSDAIEFYLSPQVHREHNCPDIMGMKWENYNGFHAFLSGVICSWFLILPLCFVNLNVTVVSLLNLINVFIPVVCFITGKDKSDPYFSHKMLYAVNPIFLTAAFIIKLVTG